MRIAFVSDIHGNLTALEAVIKDLKACAPDRIFHLGNLLANGAGPAEGLDTVSHRRISEKTIVNTGSVSLSYDGDWRASYLLMDSGKPGIRRVEYDLPKRGASPVEQPTPSEGVAGRSLAYR